MKIIVRYVACWTAILILMGTNTIRAESGGPYDLEWSTIDGAGGWSSGGVYTLTGTIGQPDTGYSAAELYVGSKPYYELFGGFWPAPRTCFVPETEPWYEQWVLQGKPRAWCCRYQSLGDVTGDGASNIFDLFAFRSAYGTTWPNPGYDCRADLYHDGAVNIFDLVIFRSNYGTTFELNYSCPWMDDCGD